MSYIKNKSKEVAYEFEFAEGFSAPDEEGMKELQDTFKEAGVPKDKAQKLIDYWGKLEEKRAEVQKAEAEATIKTMVEATRNDKEIGGTKYKESLSFAAKGRDKFSNPELNKVFDVTHLAIDRTFRILGDMGLLPPAPEALQGQNLKIKYVSLLAQAQEYLKDKSKIIIVKRSK